MEESPLAPHRTSAADTSRTDLVAACLVHAHSGQAHGEAVAGLRQAVCDARPHLQIEQIVSLTEMSEAEIRVIFEMA